MLTHVSMWLLYVGGPISTWPHRHYRKRNILSCSKYTLVDGYCQNFNRIGLVVSF